MLPEMCSRVCPQEKQCQSNCDLGHPEQAVGIGRLELWWSSIMPMVHGVAAVHRWRCAVTAPVPAARPAAQRLADQVTPSLCTRSSDRPGGLLNTAF